MTSRSRKIAKAFGSAGVLSKATLDVPEEVGGGAEEVANTAALGTGNAGAQKFVTANKSLYVYDGTEWDRINAGGDENPRLTTTPATSHSLNSDGSTSQITIAAEDPEGFPITYSHDTNPASPNQITNVAENNGVFTLTPSTNTAHAGNFTLRLKASDGVHITSHAIAVALSFQTTFTFNTSLSTINSNYTADNKVEAYVDADLTSATSQQSGILGKGYFELKYISRSSATTLMLGVEVGTNTGGYNPSGTDTGLYVYERDFSGTSALIDIGNAGYDTNYNFLLNDILMVAYDTAAGSNGQVWFGRNGTWPSGKNPASDAGHNLATNSSTAGIRPAIHTGSGDPQTFQVEMISHTQGAQYTIPTGFSLA